MVKCFQACGLSPGDILREILNLLGLFLKSSSCSPKGTLCSRVQSLLFGKIILERSDRTACSLKCFIFNFD